MSLSRAARSCHRRAVSRRHRARKRSLLLGDDFSIAVSPLRTNGRSGFWARRLSAFYGLFRSVFLIFFYSTSFSASVCFTDVGCFYFKRILLSSDRLFPTALCIGSTFFLLKHITVLFFVRSSFAKSFCGAALLPPLGRRRKRWLRCDIERK